MKSLDQIVLQNLSIKKWVSRLYYWLFAFGFDGMKFFRSIKGFFIYIKQYFQIKGMDLGEFPIKLNNPCLSDRFEDSGTARGSYFWADLLTAQKIFQANPERHVDVASRVDGLVAHLASFRQVEIFDIRPLSIEVPSLTFTQCDFTNVPQKYRAYCDSLSCIHALEHFGLGRYGDPIDPDGHIKGLKALTDILKSGGILYLGVPIGTQRIDFNAHRVFSIQTILDLTKAEYKLLDFNAIHDFGHLIKLPLTQENIQINFGCHYGFGLFILKKN